MSGISAWSDADLTQFLQTGNANWHVAAGDMGLAVERSFSHLSKDDIAAMVAYLRNVLAVDGTTPHAPLGMAQPIDVAKIEAVPDGGTTAADYPAVVNGPVLYQATCAECHGAKG